MVKWVFHWGGGVEANPEVRVRLPSVVMEVVGLWGQHLACGRSERKARRDECGPVVQQCGLLVGDVSFDAVGCPSGGAGGAVEELLSG